MDNDNLTKDSSEIYFREIHHRVKNNFQIVSNLLELQLQYTENQDALAILRECSNRIKSISLIHEKIYMSKNANRINLKDYLNELSSQLLSSYNTMSIKVVLYTNLEKLYIDTDMAIPIGLIINELISNSLKYAFVDNSIMNSKIEIESKKDNELLTVYYHDNGRGIDPEFDINTTGTMGLQLVSSLVKQMNGNLSINNIDGLQFIISVPARSNL